MVARKPLSLRLRLATAELSGSPFPLCRRALRSAIVDGYRMAPRKPLSSRYRERQRNSVLKLGAQLRKTRLARFSRYRGARQGLEQARTLTRYSRKKTSSHRMM